MREFLRSIRRWLAALGVNRTAWGDKPPADTRLWITAGDKRHEPAATITWQSGRSPDKTQTIRVDARRTYQKVTGFGGAFTDAASYVFHSMPDNARQRLFKEMFDADEMNLSAARICIGASDYSRSLYSYDDGEADPELKRFSIEHDREYILPILREARKVNPDLFLLASPWSPPGWMKANNSMLGGCMQRRYMEPYAQYFLKFLKGYEAEGVPVQAVTIQNEVDTDQDSNMAACAWPQEYEVDFVGNHLGPLFEREGVATKIFMIDHNYNLWGRAISSFESPGVYKYAAGIAWHGYVGDPAWMSRVHRAWPDAEFMLTEVTPVLDSLDFRTNRISHLRRSVPSSELMPKGIAPASRARTYQVDWTWRSMTFTDAIRNWCTTIIGWNLALDEKGQPNIGPFGCGGIVTVDSRTHAVTKSGMYHALAHYSRHLKRDAVRVDSLGDMDNLSHVAFRNPDGEVVLVVNNAGKERKIFLQVGSSTAELALPADSVTTLTWH